MVKGTDGAEQLLVADVLSDDVLLIDVASGAVRHRFDLSTSAVVPSTYPIAVAATRDGKRGFAALWNGSAVAELDLGFGQSHRHAASAAANGRDLARLASHRACVFAESEDALRCAGEPRCRGGYRAARQEDEAGRDVRHASARADVFRRRAECAGAHRGRQASLCRECGNEFRLRSFAHAGCAQASPSRPMDLYPPNGCLRDLR